MSKKIIALFLAAVLAFSCVIIVTAAGTPTIKVLTATAAPGETVTLDVQIQNNPGINTFALGFKYDTSRLSLKDVRVESALGGQYSYGTRVVWLNDANSTYNGKILTLTFDVLDSAKEGDASVSVTYSAGDISDYDENDVNFSLVSGKVMVKKATSERGTISVSSASADIGTEFYIDVFMNKNPGIATFSFGFEYDKSVLSLEEVEVNQELGGQFAYGKKAVWTGNADTLYTGKVLTLKFKVLESATEGDTTVKVVYSTGDISNYDEEDVDFDITPGVVTVKKEASLERISVKTKPSKINYFVNERLDTTGLSLYAVYSNGTTETVTAGYSCSPTVLTSAGTQKITVSYYGKTTNFNVNVSDITSETPAITVENVTAHAGDEISVKIYVKNNPGFMYMKVRMYYDPNVLEYIGAENGTVSTDAFEIGAKTDTLMEAFLWSTSADATGDGLLVTVKFKVAETAEAGDYAVEARLVEAYNYNEDEVDFVGVSGTVNVVDFIYGDVNGDGKINGRDVVKLAKYLAAYDELTGTSSVTVSPGADANGDGKINGRDIVKLRKYLANYDESTGQSSVVLGPSK